MKNKFQSLLRKNLARAKANKAFSLVELLVVIAVIGIIAAIAIPNIAGITGSATTAKDKRNAQNLSSVYASGKAAGASVTATTKTGIINELVSTGMTVPAGSTFSGAAFKVPGLSETEKAGAAAHLSDSLEYTPAN